MKEKRGQESNPAINYASEREMEREERWEMSIQGKVSQVNRNSL